MSLTFSILLSANPFRTYCGGAFQTTGKYLCEGINTCDMLFPSVLREGKWTLRYCLSKSCLMPPQPSSYTTLDCMDYFLFVPWHEQIWCTDPCWYFQTCLILSPTIICKLPVDSVFAGREQRTWINLSRFCNCLFIPSKKNMDF